MRLITRSHSSAWPPRGVLRSESCLRRRNRVRRPRQLRFLNNQEIEPIFGLQYFENRLIGSVLLVRRFGDPNDVHRDVGVPLFPRFIAVLLPDPL